MATTTEIKQNFPLESESGINKQINLQLYGSYVYLAMAFHFDRADVALRGYHTYCKGLSDRKREMACQLMTYQNKRGGRICLQDIKYAKQDFTNGQSALEMALGLEKDVNKALLELYEMAEKGKDVQFASLIGDYLDEQTELIKELGAQIASAGRAGPNLGEYLFDKESLSS